MRSRRTLLLVAALWSVGRPALAQDRLFVSSGEQRLEIGAIGRFGQPIGPAPAEAFTHVFPAARHFELSGNTIVETASGSIVYTAPQGEGITGWTATPGATRIYATTSAGGLSHTTVRAVDVATRAVVAEIVNPGSPTSLLWLPGDRVLVDGPRNTYTVFDRDLRSLGQFSVENSCLQPVWFISQHTGRAYLLTIAGYSQNFLSASLAAFDTVAGLKVGQVSLSGTLGLGHTSCAGIAVTLWTAPGPPQRFAAAVLGRDVTLSWLATDLAEGYVLDVGLAPGRTDLSFFVGSTTGVTFASVPPGAYTCGSAPAMWRAVAVRHRKSRSSCRREGPVMHIRCLRIRVLVGLALVCAAVDAGAQDRLYFDGSEIGAFGRFAERIGPSNGLEGRLIAGGRIAVHDNRVVDLRTGAERALPTGTTVVALDPARPRLIVASTPSAPGATLDVSLFDPLSATLTLLTSSACASSTIGSIVTNSSYAYSAQVVFVSRCAAAQTVQDVVAIDVQSTPPVLRVLAIPPTQGGALTASPDGRRLYFSLSAGFFGVGSTTAYDVATGDIVGVGGTNGEIVWDEARDRLFVVSRTGLETVLVSAFDRDLQFLGAAELFSRICTARLQNLAAHRAHLRLHGRHDEHDGGAGQAAGVRGRAAGPDRVGVPAAAFGADLRRGGASHGAGAAPRGPCVGHRARRDAGLAERRRGVELRPRRRAAAWPHRPQCVPRVVAIRRVRQCATGHLLPACPRRQRVRWRAAVRRDCDRRAIARAERTMRIWQTATRALIGLALVCAAVQAGAQDRLFIEGPESAKGVRSARSADSARPSAPRTGSTTRWPAAVGSAFPTPRARPTSSTFAPEHAVHCRPERTSRRWTRRGPH